MAQAARTRTTVWVPFPQAVLRMMLIFPDYLPRDTVELLRDFLQGGELVAGIRRRRRGNHRMFRWIVPLTPNFWRDASVMVVTAAVLGDNEVAKAHGLPRFDRDARFYIRQDDLDVLFPLPRPVNSTVVPEVGETISAKVWLVDEVKRMREKDYKFTKKTPLAKELESRMEAARKSGVNVHPMKWESIMANEMANLWPLAVE